MHLAGLSGMARRIPEYADFFIPFMTVGFHGTLLLIFSTLFFIRSFFFFLSHLSFANFI
jgi:heme/copper-type cytochrome/quinol oxidase subunit 1